MIPSRIASFAIATGSLILILALPGCGDILGFGDGCFFCGEVDLPDRPEVQSVTIVPDSVLLSVGQRDSLEAIVRGTDGSILSLRFPRWSSSDTAVATVSVLSLHRTAVTGRARGEASISAESGGKIGRAKVIVN